jgi:hypothetical protein
LEHFRKLFLRKLVKGYDCADPLIARWKPSEDFMIMDIVEASLIVLTRFLNVDVIWMSYEDRRDITLLNDICWYSGWIMAGKDRKYLHLPERVLRQYGYY